MTLTSHRILQYIVILLILAIAGGGYWYWKNAQAAVTQKAASKTGLVGYWSLDEGSGTSAGDASGNSNTGTLTNGPTWTSGKLGQGVSFDGTNDYVTMGNVLNLDNSDMTICAWAKGTSGGVIASKGGGNVSSANGWVFSTGNIITKQNVDPSNAYIRVNSATISTTEWVHVCAAGKYSTSGTSGQSFNFYTNGVLTNGTETNTAATGASIGLPFIIGARSYNNGSLNVISPFAGSIDDVRVYNRALGATEITNLYNLGAAKLNTSQNSQLTSGLVGLWSFNGPDVSGTTAYDRSGSGNNGTLTNGPTATIGRVGAAMNFDGTNDYMSYASNVAFDSADFTISGWVKVNGVGTGDGSHPIFEQRVDATGNGQPAVTFGLSASKNFSFIARDNVGAAATYTESTVRNYNQWYYVVGVKTSSAVSLYVDGMFIGSTSHSLSGDFDAGAVYRDFGRYRYSGADIAFLNGVIDEAHIYNRALSAAEIQTLYALGDADKINSSISQPQSTGRLDSGLAGYWKLDENTGTSAGDASTNGNTGTLTNGPTWTTGQIGSAVSFDGVDDYMETSSAIIADSSSATFSTWVKFNTTGTTQTAVSRGQDGFGTGWSVGLGKDSSDKAVFSIVTMSGGATGFSVTGATSLVAGTWYHLAGVWTAGVSLKIYVNGVSDGTTATTTTTLRSSTVGVRLARHQNAYYNVVIDEARIYNRALAADEVARLYQTTAPTDVDTGLRGYWSFNGQDVSGTIAYDRSGTGSNGTLTNGPTRTIGKVGAAMSFDGTDDYMDAGSIFNYTSGPSSFSYWIKLNSFTTNQAGQGPIPFYKGTYLVSGYYQQISQSGSVSFITNQASAAQGTSTASGAITTGVWYHIVTTRSGASVSIYINGADATASAGTHINPASSSNNFLIGRYTSFINSMDGKIDEFRAYNRALTATEVLALYNLGK